MNGARLALVAGAGALLGGAGVYALDRSRPGGDVGPQVRAYLLAHPEVIDEAGWAVLVAADG